MVYSIFVRVIFGRNRCTDYWLSFHLHHLPALVLPLLDMDIGSPILRHESRVLIQRYQCISSLRSSGPAGVLHSVCQCVASTPSKNLLFSSKLLPHRPPVLRHISPAHWHFSSLRRSPWFSDIRPHFWCVIQRRSDIIIPSIARSIGRWATLNTNPCWLSNTVLFNLETEQESACFYGLSLVGLSGMPAGQNTSKDVYCVDVTLKKTQLIIASTKSNLASSSRLF